MQPVSQSIARIEQQIINDLEPLLTTVAAYNKQIKKESDQDQIESRKRLQLMSPPGLTVITDISERKIAKLDISLKQQSSDAELADAAQQQGEQLSKPFDTLHAVKNPSTDDTESVFQKTLIFEASGTSANIAGLINDLQSRDVVVKVRQPDFIDPLQAEFIQCQTNYLESKQIITFDNRILDASFSLTGKNLVITASDDVDDFSLGIWARDLDGVWLENGSVGDYKEIFHCQLNRSENTLLSSNDDGVVTVYTLNSHGRWVLAKVLEHTPTHKDYPKVQVAFSPLQDRIMSWDPQTGRINVLYKDSNGLWTPLSQTREICHFQQYGSQQPSFRATDNYLLTYQGASATIWGFSDESNSLEEKKVIECNGNILSAQLSDDEQHALIFTEDHKAVFLGCDIDDGSWSQIAEICHPGLRSSQLNNRFGNVICHGSFNASGQHALTLDADDRAIISGYDDNGDWVVKTEIRDCAKAEFSPSGGKLLARLFKPLDCNSTGDLPGDGEAPGQSGSDEAIFSRSYGNYKLWDCSRTGDRLDNVQTLEHSGSSDVIFSPSENVLLSYGVDTNYACIWGYDEEGNLVEKARVGHQGGIDYAAFNPQEDSVLTRSHDQTTKILSLDSQGKWQEQLMVQHQGRIRDARFSPSGCLAYTVSADKTTCILGRDDSGQWMKLAVTTTPDAYSIEGAFFNELDNHFVVHGNRVNRKFIRQQGLVQLWGIGDDGKWVEKEQIKLESPVKLAKFSPDSEHLLIQCHDRRRQFSHSEAAIALLWKIPADPDYCRGLV
ncbi:WD40 repeat domain-containing protein [Endozoicomonas sp. SESOKO1]|uniref:WD40 repeat domain-containing protein n=1 Tax=Endozoicomonas sp. SESOKO1 TaxID=2828742 RepID=UPI0021498BB4|nr:WD40 repeat domain-containing protein [Endozoicomonas sp. SESOKO1]